MTRVTSISATSIFAAALIAALALGEPAAAQSHRNTASAGDPSARELVDARLVPANMSPYAGEVFDVDATVTLTGGRSAQVVGTPRWNPPGLEVEPWGDGQQVRTQGGAGVRFHTRAVASTPGRIELAPVKQDVRIDTGRGRHNPFADFDDAFDALRKFGGSDLLDSFFAAPQMTEVTAASNLAQLDVRPLPQPAPPGFGGAIGQFSLTSQLAPEQPKSGEPLTWTLTLSGTGNWPAVALPPRAVPADFRTLQPKQRAAFAAGERFSGSISEDVVLVPNHAGDYALGPVRFVYFDPATGRYETIETAPAAVHVVAGAAPASPEPAPDAAPAPAAVHAGSSADAEPRAVDASRLPRDARPGHGRGIVPLAARDLALLGAIPFALLLAYALLLVVRAARQRDPRRAQRAARAALRARVARVRDATSADERLAALLAWQRTAATALAIDAAAPIAETLPDPRWAEVWAASERALYAPGHELSAGWCNRATALTARRGLGLGAALRRVIAGRHLVPRAATAAALLVAAAAVPVRGADAIAAYTAGDFTAARDQLRAAVAAAPRDWIARYNLGLAEAQLGDHARAVAETLGAAMQAPRDADVRWNAAAFAAAVPALDPAVAAFARAPGIAALLAPAGWQIALLVALIIGCAGGVLLVRARYGASGGAVGRLAIALVVLGSAGTAAAITALHAYGPLADPRVALVVGDPTLRSVPTDAEAVQAEKHVQAGTLAFVGREEFLGWTKVALRGGETGWLRRGDVVPLYMAPGV
jgi:hypothetical protein